MAAGSFEYYKDEEKTGKNRIDGFFTVGDVGVSRRGRLAVPQRPQDRHDHLGRRQHLPGRDRGVLLTHPKIGDVAVFGIPNEDWGEESRPSSSRPPGSMAGAELERRHPRLLRREPGPATRRRSRSTSLDELPRDPNGKLYKRKLRDPYWEGRQRAI